MSLEKAVNRICFVCRKGDVAESLLRFSLTPLDERTAQLTVDGLDKKSGRGANCHPRAECLKHRGFEGKLRHSLLSVAEKGGGAKRLERSANIVGNAENALRSAWEVFQSKKQLPGSLVRKSAMRRSKLIESALRFYEPAKGESASLPSGKGSGAGGNSKSRIGAGKTLPGIRRSGKK